MKNVKGLLLVAIIAIGQSCNSGNKDSVDAAKDANDKKDSGTMSKMTDTTTSPAMSAHQVAVDKDDAAFAVEAASGGMMEVQLGNYAQQNALSQRVKNFGAMMVKDHTKAGEELKNLASAKNITLPATPGNDAQKDMADLMKKKGADFDKAYMSMMLSDHKTDIKDFEKAAKDCKDSELKGFAGKTLPVLLIHLDSCKSITGKN